MKSIFFIKRGFFESRGYSSRMLGNGAFVVQVTRLAVKSRAILTPASLIEAFDPVRFFALHEGSRQVQALAPLPCGISARYQLDGPNLRWDNVRRVFTIFRCLVPRKRLRDLPRQPLGRRIRRDGIPNEPASTMVKHQKPK